MVAVRDLRGYANAFTIDVLFDGEIEPEKGQNLALFDTVASAPNS